MISVFARKSGFLLVIAFAFSQSILAAGPVVISSPDSRIKTELSAADGTLRYRILVDGKQVLAPSTLGILSEGNVLGRNVTLGKAKLRKVNERYKFFGAHSIAINEAREASILVTSQGEDCFIDIHVANDGVGVRLRLPAKAERKVQADRSSWVIEGDAIVWADALDASYESHYRQTSLKELASNQLYGLPITTRVGNIYLTLTEAALKDYGDMAVKWDGNEFQGQLYADPDGWSTDDAVIQPWRVTVIARDLTSLVNSTLVQNLNPPADPKLANAEWIAPGRSGWQWMAVGDPQFDDQQQWVDWTQQLGFEYYLVDEGWKHWKDPWPSLATVVAYAKTKNVKVWLWVHSNEVKTPEMREAYFRKAVEAGVVGVKIDFPPPSNRWWSTWYHDTARDAAAYKLMVDYHGASKPTGMERTWPNAITREGVRGHEWHMTRYKRVLEPAHDTILPFTRYIAGAGDYTPTVFDKNELQGNTWAHELAQMVIFTSPFLCTGGHPRDYLANPAHDVMTAIPAVWDETRVLSGSDPGKIVVMARRKGHDWFVAAINGADTTNIDLSLDFLGAGRWSSVLLYDSKEKPDDWDRHEGSMSSMDALKLTLSPRGGFVGWFRQQ